MPYRMQASTAPNDVTTRLRRVRFGDLAMRVWQVAIQRQDLDPADRHDFVLIHGIGVSSRYFEPLAARLAEVGTVHLLDLPGFASVPRPGHPVEIAEFAWVVGRWIRSEKLVAPVILGHSMGAQVVAELLASEPDVASRAVLIGPPVNATERSFPAQAVRLVQSSVHESSRTRRAAMSGYARCGPRWFFETLPRMMRYRIEDRLPLVQADTLLVRGQHDTVAPRGWIEHLAALPATASWVEIPGASHAVIYEHSTRVAELTLAHARS